MKFLCDQMLARLGRWLRAAGYDTAIIDKVMIDREIFDLAVQENRFLLTRDKHFLDIPESSYQVIWLKGNTTDECAKELSEKLKLNWLILPFSRCLVCNTLLVEAPKNLYDRLPSDIIRQVKPVMYCQNCDQLFWIGSHTQRMILQLQSWNTSIY